MSFRKYTPKTRYAEGIHFDSVEALLNEDVSAEKVGYHNRRAVDTLLSEVPDWYGLPDSVPRSKIRSTIEQYAREGSPELAERIKDCFREMQNAIKITAVRRKKVKTMADFGTEVDMARIYAGDADRAWRSSRRVTVASNQAPRRIVLAVSVGGTAGVPSNELFWQGATACFLAQELMTAGYTVGIVAYSAAFGCNSGWRGAGYVVSVMVKEMHRKANMAAIAGCLGCPGFFRWLILRSRALFGFKLSFGFGATDAASTLPLEALGDGQAQILQMPVIRSLAQARQYLATAVQQLQVGVAA